MAKLTIKEISKRYYDKNKKKILFNQSQAHKINKEIVINKYGGECACCHENIIEFLVIDHINGRGNEHRKKAGVGLGVNICRWIINNNFPEGFRVLCHNCNAVLGRFGFCPHSDIKPGDPSLAPYLANGDQEDGTANQEDV
jgi:hypothetical protein